MFSLLSRGASDRAVGPPKVETRASEKTRSLKPTPRSDFREPGAFGPKDLVNGFREQTAPPAIGPSAAPKAEALDDGQAGLLHLSGLSWPYPSITIALRLLPFPRVPVQPRAKHIVSTAKQRRDDSVARVQRRNRTRRAGEAGYADAGRPSRASSALARNPPTLPLARRTCPSGIPAPRNPSPVTLVPALPTGSGQVTIRVQNGGVRGPGRRRGDS
jgi:hypothetical protein